jgi:hypothetical protein
MYILYKQHEYLGFTSSKKLGKKARLLELSGIKQLTPAMFVMI